MNKLPYFSSLFLVLCLISWLASWYVSSSKRNELHTVENECSFLKEQEKLFKQNTVKQIQIQSIEINCSSQIDKKLSELQLEQEHLIAGQQALEQGVYQRYLNEMLDSANEQQKKIRIMQLITKQLQRELPR